MNSSPEPRVHDLIDVAQWQCTACHAKEPDRDAAQRILSRIAVLIPRRGVPPNECQSGSQSSLRQLDDLIDALEVVIDANMNEGMALLYCQSGCLSGF
jgi:hypothetical protein